MEFGGTYPGSVLIHNTEFGPSRHRLNAHAVTAVANEVSSLDGEVTEKVYISHL